MSNPDFEAPDLEALSGLLPSYEFESFIAQGGMGAVYKARQRALDRDVAIKVLPRELSADPDFRLSFETEAKAMARTNHPNLISVFDFGAIDGMLYIVMEYVHGKSLYHSAYNLAVDPVQAVALVRGICEGLAHAHENGIIHRDIKPANILLNSKAEPKIGDFGLARPVESAGPGLIMGTPGYTAPEIYQDPERADAQTDIFAVGVILHELVTGRNPGDAGSQAPPATGLADTTLDRIWRKATDPDPSRRYASAAEMARDLAGWTSRPSARPVGPVPAGPVRLAQAGAPRSAPVIVRKSKPDLTVPIIVASVLVVGGALIGIQMKRQADNHREFEEKHEASVAAKAKAAEEEAAKRKAAEEAAADPDPNTIRFAPERPQPTPPPAPPAE